MTKSPQSSHSKVAFVEISSIKAQQNKIPTSSSQRKKFKLNFLRFKFRTPVVFAKRDRRKRRDAALSSEIALRGSRELPSFTSIRSTRGTKSFLASRNRKKFSLNVNKNQNAMKRIGLNCDDYYKAMISGKNVGIGTIGPSRGALKNGTVEHSLLKSLGHLKKEELRDSIAESSDAPPSPTHSKTSEKSTFSNFSRISFWKTLSPARHNRMRQNQESRSLSLSSLSSSTTNTSSSSVMRPNGNVSVRFYQKHIIDFEDGMVGLPEVLLSNLRERADKKYGTTLSQDMKLDKVDELDIASLKLNDSDKNATSHSIHDSFSESAFAVITNTDGIVLDDFNLENPWREVIYKPNAENEGIPVRESIGKNTSYQLRDITSNTSEQNKISSSSTEYPCTRSINLIGPSTISKNYMMVTAPAKQSPRDEILNQFPTFVRDDLKRDFGSSMFSRITHDTLPDNDCNCKHCQEYLTYLFEVRDIYNQFLLGKRSPRWGSCLNNAVDGDIELAAQLTRCEALIQWMDRANRPS
ncbi:hypothetical protein V1511DRAFT_503446 [Dipodascopsis uninucleata]